MNYFYLFFCIFIITEITESHELFRRDLSLKSVSASRVSVVCLSCVCRVSGLCLACVCRSVCGSLPGALNVSLSLSVVTQGGAQGVGPRQAPGGPIFLGPSRHRGDACF